MRVIVNRKGADDWLSRIEAVERGMPVASDRVSFFIAEKLFDIILNHLKAQDLPWDPLTPTYLQWKKDEGLDPRTWIATRELTSTIKIWKTPRRQTKGYSVGIPRHLKHYGSGLEAYVLAMIHEFGVPDRGIPARPLFRPSIEELKVWLRQNRNALVQHFIDQFEGVPLRVGGFMVPRGSVFPATTSV